MAEAIKYICITCHKEFSDRRCPSCGINANKCIPASEQNVPTTPVTTKKENKQMNVGRMVTTITSSESVVPSEKEPKSETSFHDEEKAGTQIQENQEAKTQKQATRKDESKKTASSSSNLDALLTTTSQRKRKQQTMSVGRLNSTTTNARTEQNSDGPSAKPQPEESGEDITRSPLPEKRENVTDSEKAAPVEGTAEKNTHSDTNDAKRQPDSGKNSGSDAVNAENLEKKNSESRENNLHQEQTIDEIQDGSITGKKATEETKAKENTPYQQPENSPKKPQSIDIEKKGSPVSVAWEKKGEQKPVKIRQEVRTNEEKNNKSGSKKKKNRVEIREDDNGKKRLAIMKKKAKAEKVDVGINFNEDDFYSDTFMFEELSPMSFRGAVIKVALTIVGIIASAIFLLNYFW